MTDTSNRFRSRFVSYTRPRGATLTRVQVAELERTSAPNPPGFTGVRSGVHYYKGAKWEGPTNRMGCRS